jgi:TRAP-type mannitol/chloroaromatic compound transport system permease small subunit
MLALCNFVDGLVRRAAAGVALLILAIAGAQLAVVVLRYFFSYGSILLQEVALNLNVAFVSMGLCYGVLRNVHTRVDVLQARQREAARCHLEFVGVALLMLPAAGFLTWALIPYVAQSWASLEGSRNVGGIPGIYIVKSCLLVASAILTLQGVAIVLRLLVERRWPYPHAADGPVDG